MRKRVGLLLGIVWGMSVAAAAQDYKYEAGGGLGIGFYMGDANQSALFRKPGPAAEVMLRRTINYRWAIKFDLATAHVKGDTRAFDTRFPGGDFYFSRQVLDLGAQAEFNFFHYGIGYSYLGTKRISPYLLAGVGVTCVPKKNDGYFNVNIPLGVGLKYKMAPRWNVGFEFSMRKTLGDKLDGKQLSDPLGIDSSLFKNTDWYSLTMISVTYDFGRKRAICNNDI